MEPMISVLAAGSLRSALTPLIAAFTRQTGLRVALRYGPAGLLRERILAGEPCSLFASADRHNAQALIDAGLAQARFPLAANRLMLSARAAACRPGDDWLALLRDPTLRVATSTPHCDPGGDYAWQLFTRLEQGYPGLGTALKRRARPLVGGRGGVTIPPGECAAAWLIRQGLTDLFIGYAHYGQQLAQAADLRVLTLPEPRTLECAVRLSVGATGDRCRQPAPVPRYAERGGAGVPAAGGVSAAVRRSANCGASSGVSNSARWILRTVMP